MTRRGCRRPGSRTRPLPRRYVVITKDQATAAKAKSALQSGDAWKTVANKYSTDAQTKQAGGVLKGAAKGSLGDQTLETAVLAS